MLAHLCPSHSSEWVNYSYYQLIIESILFLEVTMFEPDDTTTTDLNAEGKEELMDPMALTDLLADVSIDSLEQMVEEYLPEQEETETESNKEYEEYEEYDDPVDYSGESQ